MLSSPRGSSVDLQVSNGPPAALKRVPNLIGLSIGVVEDTLRKYEMRIGHIAKRIDAQKTRRHRLGAIADE